MPVITRDPQSRGAHHEHESAFYTN